MGGLGNGKRRGGRSPPLMIGALIACILVLGFNYWVSSSHNLELQTKLYELESQVRRAAAERGAAELKKNEFQEEIQRQSEQMNRMESFYNKQKEGSRDMCLQEKVCTNTQLKMLVLPQCCCSYSKNFRMILRVAVFLLVGHTAAEHFFQYQNHTGTKR
uniref:Golgi membrane protein 1 n=1 Tax=Mola mola TaxID=94237 RepID=A0A3Q3WWV9_MOLML